MFEEELILVRSIGVDHIGVVLQGRVGRVRSTITELGRADLKSHLGSIPVSLPSDPYGEQPPQAGKDVKRNRK